MHTYTLNLIHIYTYISRFYVDSCHSQRQKLNPLVSRHVSRLQICYRCCPQFFSFYLLLLSMNFFCNFLQAAAAAAAGMAAKLLALQNCICTREIGSKVMHVEVSEWWRQPRFLEVGLIKRIKVQFLVQQFIFLFADLVRMLLKIQIFLSKKK